MNEVDAGLGGGGGGGGGPGEEEEKEGLFRAKSYVEQLELELVLLLKRCILVPGPQKK
jgi:hypothetical protein